MESLIFASRWLQAPLYLGLIIAQVVYVYQFMVELKHLAVGAFTEHVSETVIMLSVLGLIDVVMIANLHLDNHPDQPEWLSHVNAGVLKVKLSTAIIGISSIHLLKTFINAANIDNHTIMWQVIIHVVFLFSALAMVWVDKLMNQSLLISKAAHDTH